MKSDQKTLFEEVTGTVDEIIREVRKLIREGNARTLIIKNKNGRVLFQTHLTVGVAGTTLFAVMAPFISALTMFVMFTNDIKVVVEKAEETDKGNSKEENHTRDEYEVEGEVIDIEDGGDEEEKDKE